VLVDIRTYEKTCTYESQMWERERVRSSSSLSVYAVLQIQYYYASLSLSLLLDSRKNEFVLLHKEIFYWQSTLSECSYVRDVVVMYEFFWWLILFARSLALFLNFYTFKFISLCRWEPLKGFFLLLHLFLEIFLRNFRKRHFWFFKKTNFNLMTLFCIDNFAIILKCLRNYIIFWRIFS
jgi:hypothetical protein